jgi:DNA-binding GntR family transcriptional regulator
VSDRHPRTSAEEIRRTLAAKIIDGTLAPGSALDECALAGEFGVSRTPIREALRLLVASGLVEQKPHMTAFVAKPDKEMLTGMFEVMGYLEALCAGLCAVAMTGSERRRLDLKHAEMGALVRSGDAESYARANERFHNAVYQGSHNRYLAEITEQTRQRLQPFRRAQFDTAGRLAKSHHEHGLVVVAILRGQRPEAELHMRRHIALVGFAYQQFAKIDQDFEAR